MKTTSTSKRVTMSKIKTPLLGAHMSIAGGPELAIERGISIRCSAIQIFTKSNRQWRATPLASSVCNLFIKKQQTIGPVVAHASYLINLGSANVQTIQKSIDGLIVELNRCQLLNIPYLVLHPGSLTEKSVANGLEKIAHNLDIALQQSDSNTMVLLENMAGQGSVSCYDFEHINLIRQFSKERNKIGVCFDTCHAFAAGYDFRTIQQYETMWHDFDRIIGLDNLKVIHVNDSKKDLGSRVDRHEHIGKGKLGIEPFSFLMNDPRLAAIIKILETPKDDLNDDLANLQILRNLIRK